MIIAGFGRFGNIVGRLLRADGTADGARSGLRPRGDAAQAGAQGVLRRRVAARPAAGGRARTKARVLVMALDDPERILEIAATAQKHFPHLAVFCRAMGGPTPTN